MKKISRTFIAAGALILAGCGGGSGSGDGSAPPSFIVWGGSSSGSNVIDGPSHLFAFFSDTGCLFNFQTGRENTAFCLSPGSNFVNYGAFHGQVVNVLVSNGTCQAAIIDSLTGNFSDIEVDSFGREVVFTTQLHPAICVQ
jgi:hypothetical protein